MTSVALLILSFTLGFAAPNTEEQKLKTIKAELDAKAKTSPRSVASAPIFDLPVTYNNRVSYWIQHFQTRGKTWFSEWLMRAEKYMPLIQSELKQNGLPQDLAFMVMIESGFEPNAKSHAEAVGPWQFISTTGERYGLKNLWWLDERRDLKKSTHAAIKYLRDLYQEFGSWYLVAASYNMGENGLRRQIQKHNTKDFWVLSRKGALPQETVDYVPKILAAMLIAKAPNLYGFSEVPKLDPLDYEIAVVPGGTDLNELADKIGVTRKCLRDLNSEVLSGYIPRQVEKHSIRIPKGASHVVAEFILNSKNPRKN